MYFPLSPSREFSPFSAGNLVGPFDFPRSEAPNLREFSDETYWRKISACRKIWPEIAEKSIGSSQCNHCFHPPYVSFQLIDDWFERDQLRDVLIDDCLQWIELKTVQLKRLTWSCIPFTHINLQSNLSESFVLIERSSITLAHNCQLNLTIEYKSIRSRATLWVECLCALLDTDLNISSLFLFEITIVNRHVRGRTDDVPIYCFSRVPHDLNLLRKFRREGENHRTKRNSVNGRSENKGKCGCEEGEGLWARASWLDQA